MAKGKSGGDAIPAGTDYQYFSRNQLSAIFGISVPTITKMVGSTMPAARRNGGMVYHLKDVATLLDIRKINDPDIEDDEEFETDPDKMKPADRRMHYQAEDLKQAAAIKSRRNDVEAGQLLEAVEVERVLAQAFKTLALTLDTLPDMLERDGLIETHDVERIIEIVDNSRAQLANDLSKMSETVEGLEAAGEW